MLIQFTVMINMKRFEFLFKLRYIADGMTKIGLNITQILFGQYDNIN